MQNGYANKSACRVTGRYAHFPVRPDSFRPPLRESFRPPTLSRFAHYLMSRFAQFLNLYFIEDIVINLQFFVSFYEDFGYISLKNDITFIR